MNATVDMKDVGSHLFCTQCFANLLSPKPKAEPEPEPEAVAEPISFSFESALQGEVKSQAERCFVCQQELPERGHTKLGKIGVCQSCREGLTLPPPVEPPAKKIPVVETEEVDPGPMYTPGSASDDCPACQRGTPRPASFHEVDGAYYCPDCFYSGKAQPQVSKEPANAEEPRVLEPAPESLGQTPGAGEKCDACMRPLVRHYFELLSGFSICRACTSSNQDLALTIARVRHKRHLEEIAQGLAASKSH